MRRRTPFQVTSCVLTAAVLGGTPAWASPAGTFMPQSFLGEAAVVAFAFSLPALVAGAYLVMERLWVGLQRRIGIATAAVGLIALVAIAAVSALGGDGGSWIVLARS